jgi:hypothetical protein
MISRNQQIIGVIAAALVVGLSAIGAFATPQQAYADQRATCENQRNVIGACVQAQVDKICVGILATRPEC